LRGRWQDSQGSGDLWWGGGGQDVGYEEFENWKELEKKYYEVFARLKANDVLRDAMLQKNYEMIHIWPQETEH
jgi:hypothetical protein